MGRDRHLHLGAYLRITVQSVPRTHRVRQCAGDSEHRVTGAPFCSQCGSAVKPREIEKDGFPTLLDLEDELAMGETLQELGEELDGAVIVAINNMRHVDGTDYDIDNGGDCVVDITNHDRPQAMCEAFARAFEKEISALEGHPDVLSVAVRFGFIDYWS
jgi:hypothetical protein